MGYKVIVRCDTCGNGFSWTDITVTYNTAIRIARNEGWQVGKKGWLCPNCKQMKKKKENKHG